MEPASIALLRELGINTGLMSVLVLAYSLVPPEAQDGLRVRWREGLHGLVFGGSAVLAMQFPLSVAPGVLVDAKTVVLALAGAFLAAPAAALALALAGAYRGWVGGIGAPAGLATLLLATALGMLWRWRRADTRAATPALWWLLSLGAAVSATALALTLTLPGALGWTLLPKLLAPVPAVFVTGILLFGSLLDSVRSRMQALQSLQQREKALAVALHARSLGEERLKLALDASGDAMWSWEPISRQSYVSDRCFTQLGLEPPDAPSQRRESLRARFHPDDLRQLDALIEADDPTGDPPIRHELRALDAQQQWHWLLVRGRVVERDAQGRPVRLAGTNSDIHAAKVQAEALAQSRTHFRAIYDTAPDAMGILRLADAVFLDVNAAFEAIIGYHRDEAIGQPLPSLRLWPDDASRQRLMQALRGGGGFDSIEVELQRQNGEMLWGLLSSRPMLVEGQRCALFILRDLTDRRRIETEARREHAERMTAEAASRAKTEFLSRMSHELRTPLNAVLGFAQLLGADPTAPLSERQRSQVDAILRAGWHLLALINDVLDVARIESGQLQLNPRQVDMVALCHEVVNLLRPEAQATQVSMQVDAPPGSTPKAWADAMRTRQIMLNLLGNALKYNRPGGSVRVDLWAEPDGLRVAVVDTGIGMTAEQLSRLFEPFNRLGRERGSIEGSGIGMALARHLAMLMQGSIDVQSQPGQGTCVTLRLPGEAAFEAAAPTRPAALSPQHAADDPSLAGRVLLIEDSTVNQLVVEGMLAVWPGIELKVAATGADGLRLSRDWRPDMVLLDLGLPDMDGIQVLEQLRADPDCRHLFVAVLSASVMAADVERARAAGVDDFWTKPLDLTSFRTDMRRVLGNRVKA